MWSGIVFDPAPMAAYAIEFYNLFQPIVYFVGGISLALLILRAVISIVKHAS